MLTFLDNTVDRNTGTIVARATIANPDHTLLPGEFVHVRLHVADRPDTLLVPQVALASSQLGKYVYVADNGKAEQRMVSIGAAYGNLVAITDGITAGEAVIVGNMQKITPGAPVKYRWTAVTNSVQTLRGRGLPRLVLPFLFESAPCGKPMPHCPSPSCKAARLRT
jgi:RND family efflux transporter MFP subunit